MPNYSDLSREELVLLLEARDRGDSTRFGLVWEANEIKRERALNSDFVALDLDESLSCGAEPWKNLIVGGKNFDALRYLRKACLSGLRLTQSLTTGMSVRVGITGSIREIAKPNPLY